MSVYFLAPVEAHAGPPELDLDELVMTGGDDDDKGMKEEGGRRSVQTVAAGVGVIVNRANRGRATDPNAARPSEAELAAISAPTSASDIEAGDCRQSSRSSGSSCSGGQQGVILGAVSVPP